MKKGGYTAFFHLFYNCHFIYQMPCTCELVDNEEHIADVDADIATDVGVVDEVAHRAFPAAVKVEAEELAFGIQNRAARVAACGVHTGGESHVHGAVLVGIATVVLVVIELL